MKIKTAMMELFDELDNPSINMNLLFDKDFREYYMQKEKEQIMECYIDGWEGWWTCTDEEFYKQKYKQD